YGACQRSCSASLPSGAVISASTAAASSRLALIASRLSERSSFCTSTLLPVVAPFASAMRTSLASGTLLNADDRPHSRAHAIRELALRASQHDAIDRPTQQAQRVLRRDAPQCTPRG